MKNNPFSSIDPVLKFKEIKNMVEKMNKEELMWVSEILEKRLKELNQQNQLKKECKSNHK
tara:strand:- start:1236 stop:1415 length:180 start_codon:yes stop_codon:yes gene_type:complete